MQRLVQLLPTSRQNFKHSLLQQQRFFARIRTTYPLSTVVTQRFIGPHVFGTTQSRANSYISDHIMNNISQSTRDNTVTKTPEERWRQQSQLGLMIARSTPPASPYAGRSVTVTKHTGLQAALRKLDGILSRNRVKQQLRLTERHEKKGVKRRRLQSERWRKQFANEVRQKVALVLKIKNRGA